MQVVHVLLGFRKRLKNVKEQIYSLFFSRHVYFTYNNGLFQGEISTILAEGRVAEEKNRQEQKWE